MIKPTYYYPSVSEIKVEDIVSINKKYCLVDMDNTLSIFNEEHMTEDGEKFIKNLFNADLKVIIISNNNEKRVRKALNGFDMLVLAKAYKPFKKKTMNFLNKQGINTSECIIIGDQLYTDIKLANNANIDSILVEPLVKKDLLITRINRNLDKNLRKKLKKKGMLNKIHG